MIDKSETILRDISVFADLGTSELLVSETDSGFYTELIRHGVSCKLVFYADGRVAETTPNSSRLHATFKSLLASENFANLGRWADSQQLLLKSKVAQDTISVTGLISKSGEIGDVKFLDDYVTELGRSNPRVLVTLIDGPAGIGKTSLLRALSMNRALEFRTRQRPLVLHVESRGRMLQNLTDLMAFSLQTLRVSVTYDQIPVLVRNGLITLAIDGFDELGDPSGYDLAWAQVNELIVDSRGAGNIILAGRETFIGESRILAAINSIDSAKDLLITYSLNAISPQDARAWLKNNGWSTEFFSSEIIDPIFEDGSYALRPFFLAELARSGIVEQIADGKISDLLTFLVDAMIEREATKFGKDIEAVSTAVDRERFVRMLMEEVARDLAENQSVSVSADNLMWLSDTVAAGIFPESLWGMLKNRAGVIAFLTEDDRRGYKRFIHDQVNNHFLSHVTVRSVISGEVAKYIRRNIIGLDFLEAFSDVIRQYEFSEAELFVELAQFQIDNVAGSDRTRGNLAALLFSVASVVPLGKAIEIKDVSIDEAWLSETVSSVSLQRVTISQLYARGADLRAVQFSDGCFVITLLADDVTVVPKKVPVPTVLGLTDGTYADPRDILRWIATHRPESNSGSERMSFSLVDFGLFPLFNRLVRYKPFWLKNGDERAARRILEDAHWDRLSSLMRKHNLLVERYDVPASGPKEAFYHVRSRAMLLGHEAPNGDMQKFLQELMAESIDVEGGAQIAAKKLTLGSSWPEK